MPSAVALQEVLIQVAKRLYSGGFRQRPLRAILTLDLWTMLAFKVYIELQAVLTVEDKK